MSESQKPVEVPVKDCIDDILLLSSVRDDARASLVDMLECFRGRKCLFYDKQLGGILAQLSNDMKKFYQECGVYYFRELSGNLQDFINECGKDIPENVIFLVRPNLSTMKTIAESMLGIQRLGARSQFRVCFAPCSTTICLHFLEEMVHDVEIWERISFKDYKIGLMPFDSDLLSFEIDDVFKQVFTCRCQFLSSDSLFFALVVLCGWRFIYAECNCSWFGKITIPIRCHPKHKK